MKTIIIILIILYSFSLKAETYLCNVNANYIIYEDKIIVNGTKNNLITLNRDGDVLKNLPDSSKLIYILSEESLTLTAIFTPRGSNKANEPKSYDLDLVVQGSNKLGDYYKDTKIYRIKKPGHIHFQINTETLHFVLSKTMFEGAKSEMGYCVIN